MDWNFPLMHWAGGIVIGVAVGYGVFRYVVHDLRADRRQQRADRRDEPTPKA